MAVEEVAIHDVVNGSDVVGARRGAETKIDGRWIFADIGTVEDRPTKLKATRGPTRVCSLKGRQSFFVRSSPKAPKWSRTGLPSRAERVCRRPLEIGQRKVRRGNRSQQPCFSD